MSNIPENFHYTKEHEWVHEVSPGLVRFGITDYAQEALGDIVFVTLPNVGQEVAVGSPCGEVESTKSVSDIYAPVDGVIVTRNDAVETSPETMNQDPYGNGWIADIEVKGGSISAQGNLLDAAGYRAFISES